MRVVLVANTLPHTDISGVGEQVVQLGFGLESGGHEIHVLGRGPGGAPGPKLLFPFTVLPELVRLLYRFRPHVVQVHESDGALAALVVRTLQALLDPMPRLVVLLQVSYLEEMRAVRPLVDEGLTLGAPGWRERGFKWLKAPVQVGFGALTAWLADRVLAPSRRTAREIERDYRVTSVEVLPNVTGARRGGGGSVEGETPAGHLLFVGRLRIRKGVEVLLHALERLQRSEPEARLLVVGSGEHRHHLEEVVSKLGLGSRVTFLGRCPPARIAGLMSGARALVVPSIYEGMPLVIVEAMAAGLAIVASRVSGIPEVVVDGETGWLVPPEDVSALEAALMEVYRRPDEARRRGEEGRRSVRRLATPGEAARRWIELVS